MKTKIQEILSSKITLYIIIGVMAFIMVNQYQQNSALEKSVEIFEKDHEQLREQNLKLIDSLQQLKDARIEVITSREKEINDILDEIQSILNTTDNEKDIDTMRDPDSIAQLFARHYPDKHRTGTGSD